jgi:endonuclease/exonuclease/phosphatase family metal-dependent hydrolase
VQKGIIGAEASTTPTTQPENTYQFSADAAIWEPSQPPVTPRKDSMPNSLIISSYNVLVDSLYPTAQDRYFLLLRNLLSESALADVLVLQEVSDDFLSYLLRNDSVRRRYSFVTHGPPDQLGIGPLASLRNIVVLSRWNFSWEYVPFKRRHKGTVILKLETIGKWENSEFLPLIVAGVHLTSGLTDGSVAAKQSQLHTIINHLNRNYQDNPWILAGDFNLTTSAFTIDSALKNKSISSQTAFATSFLETMLSEARLSDSWLVARADTGDTWRPTQRPMNFDELYQGEEGATFDPGENALAAESVGKGLNNRPQRYDRILVKGENLLGVTGFNMFGFTEDSSGKTSYGEMLVENAVPNYGSDHWGIRASFRTDIDPVAGQSAKIEGCRSTLLQIRKAPLGLSDITAFKSCLAEFRMVPTDEELSKRKEVFELLRSVLQRSPSQDNSRSSFSIVVVQTGSYSLGVWTRASDVDCLCIGSIRAKTFFALAGHRLRKAVDLGIKILRKVKANSGTMLELEIRGVKLDLQYCPATKIAERYTHPVAVLVEVIHWC